MSEPRAPTDTRSRPTLLLIWAICATLLALLATGVAIYFALQLRGPHPGPVGWTRWETGAGGNGHWYKAVLVPGGITWTDAARQARAEGGYLATLTTEAENLFAFSLVNAPEYFTHSKGPALGGFQQDGSPEPDGGWTWITGEPWHFTHWDPAEPNNSRHTTGLEDRLEFYSRVPGRPAPTWNDVNRDDTTVDSYLMERND